MAPCATVERAGNSIAFRGRSIVIPRVSTRKIRHLLVVSKASSVRLSRGMRGTPHTEVVSHANRREHKAIPRGCTTVNHALPETVFSIGTVAVLPLYGAVIAAPKSDITQKLMRSSIPFAVMCSLYFVAMAVTVQSPEIYALLRDFVSGVLKSGDFIGKWLTFVSSCFGAAATAASAWMHLLSLDLFVARSVYLDSLKTNVPSAHSLVLCCMFGPCGFLAHAVTKAMWSKRAR